MTDNKLVRSAGLLLVAIPLVLPVGTVTEAHTPEIVAPSISHIKLTSFTSEIVTVVQPTVTMEVVLKPAVAAPKISAITAVSGGSYLPEPDLSGKRAVVQQAAAAYGIDWKILEAVWQVESGKRWRTTVTSYAGASGPCQFMPGTWRAYAIDGNGDGKKDVTYAPDCLFGAAKLLATNGANRGEVVQALLRYNQSMAYVNKVLSIAKSIEG